jgi:hypothetical protein
VNQVHYLNITSVEIQRKEKGGPKMKNRPHVTCRGGRTRPDLRNLSDLIFFKVKLI